MSNFLWWISSTNEFNWHCLYVKEALRDWLLKWKFKKLGMTLLPLHPCKSNYLATIQNKWALFK